MDMHIMHLCVYVLVTSLVLDLRYYKPINLLIFQPAPSLLLCAVSPGFINLKEIEIESQICLAAFVGCKKQTHKYKAVDFPYVNFSLSQAMAAQAWHELWRHIKCVCVSLSCLWDVWCAWRLRCLLLFHRISVLLLLLESMAQAAQQFGKETFAFLGLKLWKGRSTTALAFAPIRLPFAPRGS